MTTITTTERAAANAAIAGQQRAARRAALASQTQQTSDAIRARLAAGLDTYFYTSWGYDQTNVDFYKVLGLTPSGKSVRIQHWTKRDVATDDNMHQSLVPGGECALSTNWGEDGVRRTNVAPVETARIVGFHITAGGQYAWLWDGRPKYATGHGYGH